MIFVCLLSGLISVILNIQGDCDEAFNYWEPMYLLYKNRTAFQTWEYSPQFALRSYLFLIIFGMASLINRLLGFAKVFEFLIIRFFLSLVSALPHFLYTKHFSDSCIYLLVIYSMFSFISPAYFLTATNLVPSAISNSFTLLSLYFLTKRNYFLSIGVIAFMSIVLWPFCSLLGLPVFLSALVSRGVLFTLGTSVFWGLTFGIPMFLVDSYFFGQPVLAPINILKYNVFGSIFFEGTSSELYGTEDLLYYFKNLALNFHISLPVFFVSLPITLLVFLIQKHYNKTDQNLVSTLVSSQSMVVLWCTVFFLQPHKEERFLYPVYNLISFNSSLSVYLIFKGLSWKTNCILRMLRRSLELLLGLFLIIFAIMSFSRIYAIHLNYSAPLKLMTHLNTSKEGEKLCLGRAWHFFPNRFLVSGDKELEISFIESQFGGQLPANYKLDKTITAATRRDGGKFNLFNKKEDDRFIKSLSPDKYCTWVMDYEEPYLKDEFDFSRSNSYKIMEEVDMLSHSKPAGLYKRLLTSIFYIPRLYNISDRRLSLRLYKKI